MRALCGLLLLAVLALDGGRELESPGPGPDPSAPAAETAVGLAELGGAPALQTLVRRVRTRVRFDGPLPAERPDRLLGASFGTREQSSAGSTRRILRQARRSALAIGPALRDGRSGISSAFTTTRPPPVRA